jgi:hypothetical protein
MPNNKIFILGMGAQKSGTSWLYRYLDNTDEFERGIFKEYHVLDAIFCPEMKGRYKKTMKVASQVLSQKKKLPISQQRFVHRASLTLHPQYYYDHFVNLLQKHNKRIVGDFSPTHCALPKAALQEVIKEFYKRDIDVKPVFLMRDPIERVWSALRMARRDKLLRKDDFQRLGISDPYKLSDDELLRILPDTPGYMIRSNYQKTIENIDDIFPRNDITYAFYEELFTETSIKKIADKIGFGYVKPNFNEVANSSPKKSTLSPETLTYLRNRYDDVYHFVGDRFGSERIANLWPHYQNIEG